MTEDDQANREAPRAAQDAAPGFVARWSRRKREARAAAERETDNTAQKLSAERDRTPGAGDPHSPSSEVREIDHPADDPPTDADLSPLESLDADSDYSAFLSPRVSAELKRAALRKLFHSPKFNVRCPLDSEAGNFTKFQPLGDVVTADMRHQFERARQALKDKALEAASRQRPASNDAVAAAPDAPGSAKHAADVAPDARSMRETDAGDDTSVKDSS